MRTENCQNLIIGFKVTVKNVGDVFLRHSIWAYWYEHVHFFIISESQV